MFGLGIWELLLILLILLLFFGARRLPEIGSSLGEGIREFKESLGEVEEEDTETGGGKELPPRQPGDTEPGER